MPKVIRHGREVIVEPLCVSCLQSYDHKFGYCDTYPDGIPDALLRGEHNHRKPYGGDLVPDWLYEPLSKNEVD
jgi:hypothetical protein